MELIKSNTAKYLINLKSMNFKNIFQVIIEPVFENSIKKENSIRKNRGLFCKNDKK